MDLVYNKFGKFIEKKELCGVFKIVPHEVGSIFYRPGYNWRLEENRIFF